MSNIIEKDDESYSIAIDGSRGDPSSHNRFCRVVIQYDSKEIILFIGVNNITLNQSGILDHKKREDKRQEVSELYTKVQIIKGRIDDLHEGRFTPETEYDIHSDSHGNPIEYLISKLKEEIKKKQSPNRLIEGFARRK